MCVYICIYINIYIYILQNKIHFSVVDPIEVHFVGYLYIVDLINARKMERIGEFSTVSVQTSHALTIV